MRHLVWLLGLALMITATGCSKGGPYGMSWDRHEFQSSVTLPKTIIIRDTTAGEDLIRIDIPVRKKLVIDFEHQHTWITTQTGAHPAESVSWQLIDPSDWQPIVGKLKHRMELSGNNVIIKQVIRDTADVPTAAAAPRNPVTVLSKPAASRREPVTMQPQPAPQPEPIVIETVPRAEPAPVVVDRSGGVGFKVEKRPRELRVLEVYVNSPAAAAGIRAGDSVMAIDDIDVDALSLGSAIDKLRGAVGSQVVLSVERPSGERHEIVVIRQRVTSTKPIAPQFDLDAPDPVKVETKPVE